MRKRLSILITIIMLLNTFSMPSLADVENIGFENDLSDWTTLNASIIDTSSATHTFTTSSNSWAIGAKEDKMVKIQPSGSTSNIDTIGDTLSISQDSKDYFTSNFPSPTNFAYVYQDISLTAGQTYEIYWNFFATDHQGYNDASILTFANLDDASKLGQIDGGYTEIKILGAITPGTGEYSTGSYLSTGWQKTEFKAMQSGNYRLGITAFNLSDTVAAPIVFVDDGVGTLTLGGNTYDPIDKDPNAPKPASKAITYSTKIFEESDDDDGSVKTTATLALENDTFTGPDNTQMTNVVISNVPSGLTAQLIQKSSTEASLTFSGNADSHVADITDISVVFSDAAFTSGNASIVANASVTDINIDFISTANTEADLVALNISNGSLSPNFDKDTTSYFVEVNNDVQSISITSTVSSGAAVTVNDIAVTSGDESQSIDLNVGSNAISIVVTSEDTLTTKSYTLSVNRAGSNDANLTNLKSSVGTITPSFTSAKTSYSIKVNHIVDSIKFTPTVTSGAAITINGVDVDSGDQSESIALNMGDNAVSIVVTAEDGVTTKSYSVSVGRFFLNRRDSDDNKSNNDSEPDPEPDRQSPKVIINGKVQDAGIENIKVKNGEKVLSVQVDKKAVDAKIKEALALETETRNQIRFPVNNQNQNSSEVLLTGDLVKNLEDSQFDVIIESDDISYAIPAKEIEINRVANVLDVDADSLEKIVISVEMKKIKKFNLDPIESDLRNTGLTVSIDPMEFVINATITDNDNNEKVVEIKRFSQHVTRSITISDDVASQITTGVVINNDNTLSHIPTQLFNENGVWRADFNSITNSLYTAVYNNVSADNFKGHWSQTAVEDLASRLIVNNYDDIMPSDLVTRGDFVDYVVKGIGLHRTGSAIRGLYKDIPVNHKHADSLSIASENGIASGYADGYFHPESHITREEAIVVCINALNFVRDLEKHENQINTFTDYTNVSDWAKSAVDHAEEYGIITSKSSLTISPKENMTYAEAITFVRNMLMKSNLIN